MKRLILHSNITFNKKRICEQTSDEVADFLHSIWSMNDSLHTGVGKNYQRLIIDQLVRLIVIGI